MLDLKTEPDLQKNIVNFGYGIDCKFDGPLSHSIDRFLCSYKIPITKVKWYALES